MTQLTTSFSVLFGATLMLGCGDGQHMSPSRATPTSSAVPTSTSNAKTPSSPSNQTQWLFADDEHGVFPKDRVLDIQVAIREEAWAKLMATAKREVWSVADVSIDGQILGEIGIRPKGEYSLDSCIDDSGKLTCEKLSFKLKFNQVTPEGRFYGLKKLVLNQILDGAAVFRETLAYQIFNDFGIVAPRTSYAVLTVNGQSLGLYGVVEVVDGRFTARHFADGDGNLYKEAWPTKTSTTYFKEALETNEEVATHEGMLAFAKDMLAAGDDALPQTLARYTDFDRMLDYMAVDYAIANWDGVTTFYAGSWGRTNHNFYFYQDEAASRFTLIPWDLNATFVLEHWLGDIPPWNALDVDCNAMIPIKDSSDLYTIPAACDPVIRAIALSTDSYKASARRLLDRVFVLDKLYARIDEYVKQVTPSLRNDPFVSRAELTSRAEYMKELLPAFRARLEAVLSEPPRE
jgi:spore coat protein H